MSAARVWQLALVAGAVSLAAPPVRGMLLRGWVAVTKSRMITVRADR